LDGACDHDAGEGRGESRVVAQNGGGAGVLIDLREFGVDLGAAGARHVVVGQGGFEASGGLVVFLVGDGLFGGEFFHAVEGGLGEIEIGFGGCGGVVEFRHGAEHLSTVCAGAADVNIEIASV